MSKGNVYLDNAATTPLSGEVFRAMLPYLRETFGNASSVHGPGRKARYAIEDARERVARILGCEPAEVIFTSGGTEADNLAVRSLALSGAVAASPAEHKAVLTPLSDVEVNWLPVDEFASVTGLADALSSETSAITAMYVNNETGAINNLADLAGECKKHKLILHTDAVQAAGLLDLNVDALGVDMLTLSGHKIGGPKGTGVLYVRGGTPFSELISGGSQERGRRGGTENVAGIIGFATALERAVDERETWSESCAELRSVFLERLEDVVPVDYRLNSPGNGAAHIVNIAFPPIDEQPVDGEMLILNLDVEGLSVSSGSACTSGTVEPSHVLLATGMDRDTAAASIRVSFGKQNTVDDIDFAVAAIDKVIRRMTGRLERRKVV